MSANNSTLEEIIVELGRNVRIDLATVRRWMQTDDIEAMGALMNLLTEEKHVHRVEPPVALEDYYAFVALYYERCLSENPDGEWSDSRTTAGWDFAKWFVQLWDDESVSRDVLSNLRVMLEKTCKNRGTEICNALVTAVLEHLFQRSEIKDYFSSWKDDPKLAAAYNEASDLANLKAHARLK
jgi:hypothetical protein